MCPLQQQPEITWQREAVGVVTARSCYFPEMMWREEGMLGLELDTCHPWGHDGYGGELGGRRQGRLGDVAALPTPVDAWHRRVSISQDLRSQNPRA